MSTAIQPRTIRGLNRPRYEYLLYNPGPEAVSGKYNSEDYVIPGRSEFWTDPQTGQRFHEPGVLPLIPRGVHRIFRDFKPAFEPVTAEEVARHLVGEDGRSGQLGARGVRLLNPTAETGVNLDIKADADAMWSEWQYQDDLHLTQTYESEQAALKAAGMPLRRPDRKLQAAYLRLAQYQSGGVGEPFSCGQCNQGAKDEAVLKHHIETFHPLKKQELLEQAGLAKKQPAQAQPAAETFNEPPPERPDLSMLDVDLKDMPDDIEEPKRRGRPRKEIVA